jgi:hypothetical protein
MTPIKAVGEVKISKNHKAETGVGMSTQAKIVGALQSKDLAWHAEFQQSIDRITALGLSDPLGSALLRLKYCRDKTALPRAAALLTKRAANALGVMPQFVRPLAYAAIFEWHHDACDVCRGAGSVKAKNGVLGECTKCSGSGLRRYADHERAKAAGIAVELWPKRERHYLEMQSILSGAVAAMSGRAGALLRQEEEIA